MFKKIGKNLLVFTLLSGGLFLAQQVLAQDLFGTGAVNNGLNGVLSSDDPDKGVYAILDLGRNMAPYESS